MVTGVVRAPVATSKFAPNPVKISIISKLVDLPLPPWSGPFREHGLNPLLSAANPLTHLFSRARKKGFSFFSVRRPRPDRPQNPAPAGCVFSTRKSRSEVPEREDFGEENCLGKGGADRAKKGKKGCTKKVG